MTTMKMKLLDYTLICLLAGVSPLAAAQESSQAADGKPNGGKRVEPRKVAS